MTRSYKMMVYYSGSFQEWLFLKKIKEGDKMRNVLIVTGSGSVPGLGQIEKTVPFKNLNSWELEKYKMNERLIVDKHGHVIKRITKDDLIRLDKEIEKKFGPANKDKALRGYRRK